MKSLKGLSIFTLLVALITGCNQLEIQLEDEKFQTHQINEITAYNGDTSTKTVLADDRTSILWKPNDQIKVFYGSASAQFTSINTEPEECTIFSCNTSLIYGGTESSSEYIWAVYPYSDASVHDKTSVSLTVPNSISAVEGSFVNGSFPAIGRSKDTNIGFYNVCGGICFTVTDENVHSVTITGNNNEDIAGTVKVGFDENNRPLVTEVTAGKKSITISCGYSSSCFEVGTWYYIPMLPVNFTNGFTMEFSRPYKGEGTESAILVTNKSYEVKRSIFGQLENADNNLTYRVRVSSISLNKSTALVEPLSTVQLTYTLSPSGAIYDSIEWTTSDESIATVDQNGLVTAVSYGTCTITLTADDVSASCTVYVASPSVTTQAATSVSCGSAILNGMLSAPEIDNYYRKMSFKYSKSSNTVEGLIGSSTTISSVSVDGDNFYVSITNLEPNTTYYYIACCYYSKSKYSTNGDYTYYGDVQSFTTPSVPAISDGVIDMGLSVKWAGTNVGANSPEEVGYLYAWGEVSPKEEYTFDNYVWWDYRFSDGDDGWWSDTSIEKYGSSYSDSDYERWDGYYDSYYWFDDYRTVLELDDDAARAEWRGTWRMPTQAECQELVDNCTIEKVKYNNCDGFLFTCTKPGYTDKRLFFPLTPSKYMGDETMFESSSKRYSGLCWSSTQYLPFPVCAYAFRSVDPYTSCTLGPISRNVGFPVRPVKQ